MKPKFWAIIAGLALIITITAAVLYRSIPQSPTVIINNHAFLVKVAQDAKEQEIGLSTTNHLDDNQGMYFPLYNRPASFWMKDMQIPIDIIWIDNNTIVGINHNAQPQPNISDDQLQRYHSPVSQPDAVLEIAAHRSQQLDLKIGDKVTYLP